MVESSKIVLTKVRVELHAPFVSTGTKINYRVYSIVFKLTSSDEWKWAYAKELICHSTDRLDVVLNCYVNYVNL